MRYYQFNAIVTDYEYYYIDHFFCKSTEEFIQKIQRQDAMTIKDTRERKIKRYFKYNKITKEKIEYIEKETKLNLSKYKDKLIPHKRLFLNIYFIVRYDLLTILSILINRSNIFN